MAQIYTYNGKQVYDNNGQTYDAKTGQVINKSAPVQQQQSVPQQQQQQTYQSAPQQQTYQQPVQQGTGQRQYVRIDQDMGDGSTGQRRFFERKGGQLVPVTDPETLRRLDASQILFDTERRQIDFQSMESAPPFPTGNLEPGQASDDVKKLQQWLIQQGFNIAAGATGFYGQQTKAAVEQWQKANGVDGGQYNGFWGPKSIQAAQSTFQQQTLNRGSISSQYDPARGALDQLRSQNSQLAGLPADFQELYASLDTMLKELYKRGQSINPNISISPEKIAEFLKVAEGEINPYFQTQLKLAREGFLRSVGYQTDEVLRKERELERTYGKAVRNIGENAADTGFALSGRRQEEERELAEGTQEEIEARRRELSFGTQGLAQSYAQLYGKPGDLPQIGNAPRVLQGQGSFQQQGGSSPLYSLSPETYDSLVGSQEFERRGAVQSRASGLEEAFRTQQAINQQRSLTL